MENINYVINPYITIRKSGLKKYLIKQGIISSKSFVLEADDLSETDIHFLDKVATGQSINLSQSACPVTTCQGLSNHFYGVFYLFLAPFP